MHAVFRSVLEMSAAASWLVPAVMLLRWLLKKAPKWTHCLLWALVALRLLIPVLPQSGLSLVPNQPLPSGAEELLDDYVGDTSVYWDRSEEYLQAIEAGVKPLDGGEGGHYVVTGQTPQTPPKTLEEVFAQIWLLGMAMMALHALISYGKVHKKVSASLAEGEDVFLCDYIHTPFILGLLRPRIYLPSRLTGEIRDHVLAHERAHIRRRDHWWKPLGYLLLTVHWFNPLIWLAYILLCRDIELACDEKVIRQMDGADKKAYSESLLSCSMPRYLIAACPLAFGEVGVKQRIQLVLSYKKPAFWAIAGGLVICLAAAVAFLTDPQADIFGADYQVVQVVYQNPVSSTCQAPKKFSYYRLTENKMISAAPGMMLSGTASTALPVTELLWLDPMPMEKMDLSSGYFEGKLNLIVDPETEILWKENRSAWVSEEETGFFTWLLSQKDRSLYAVEGTGRTIDWILRLGKITAEDPLDPYSKADSPYQWTRNLWLEHVGSVQVMGTDWDGKQRQMTMGQEASQLISVLNDLTPESISLGRLENPIQVSVMVESLRDGKRDDSLDVHLLFDGERTALVFQPENTSYPSGENQNWILENEPLKVFLQEFVNMPQGENPYLGTDSPFQWTKNVREAQLSYAFLIFPGDPLYTRKIREAELQMLIRLLNGIQETEVVVRQPQGTEDPLWQQGGTRIELLNEDLESVTLRLVDGKVILMSESDSEVWRAEGYWVLENEALKQWMEALTYSGSSLLTQENYQEVSQLLQWKNVEFFHVQTYGSFLFLGCRSQDGKAAIACFAGNSVEGYTLSRVLREESLPKCESGEKLWHGEFEGLQLFLCLNGSITALEWVGAEVRIPVEANCVIATQRPENAVGYRFCYGEDGATTMTMED